MSLKPTVRMAFLAVALLGLAVHVAGPKSAAAAPQGPPPAPPAAAVSPSPAPAATPRPGKDPLLEFVPKEHVPADSAVSFPVDL